VTIEKVMTVLLVHGEGDRATVNALQRHRNNVELSNFARFNAGKPVPQHLSAEPDEPPDVVVLLVDADGRRVEWPVRTWDEVEQWQALAGWDPEKRHWRHGAAVTLALS